MGMEGTVAWFRNKFRDIYDVTSMAHGKRRVVDQEKPDGTNTIMTFRDQIC